jgi:hypothetical protein
MLLCVPQTCISGEHFNQMLEGSRSRTECRHGPLAWSWPWASYPNAGRKVTRCPLSWTCISEPSLLTSGYMLDHSLQGIVLPCRVETLSLQACSSCFVRRHVAGRPGDYETRSRGLPAWCLAHVRQEVAMRQVLNVMFMPRCPAVYRH